MKQYNNGQRPTKMYGGGMAMPRKPMMMGGLAEKNREQTTMTAPKKDPMGMMTQEKKFGMGYNLGGAIAKFEGKQKKSNGGKAMTAKQKKFAALAEPRNKITYADKIAGATKKS
jgi:hypothetical protein